MNSDDKGDAMITLYTWATPNGRKVSIMLEECALPYTAKTINITAGEQREPGFLALNPNGKIPVLVDEDGPDNEPITLSESIPSERKNGVKTRVCGSNTVRQPRASSQPEAKKSLPPDSTPSSTGPQHTPSVLPKCRKVVSPRRSTASPAPTQSHSCWRASSNTTAHTASLGQRSGQAEARTPARNPSGQAFATLW